MDHTFWSSRARSLHPYTAGEQPKVKLIKLNTNENAYPPSPHVEQAVRQACHDLQAYPPPDGGIFREAAAELNGLDKDEIYCANGSDEALALSFMAFFDPDIPIHTLDVTYSFYPVWAQLYDMQLEPVPVEEDFSVFTAGFANARSVVIANPNAPTGIELAPELLEEIIAGTPGPVIVDEAYMGFGAVSVLPLIRKYDNLIVVRTLSKAYSLAGLRAGYVAANPGLIEALETVRDSFNSYPVDRLAIAAATAALDDQAWHQACCRRIVATRDHTREVLMDLGYNVLPSKANFLFVECRDAKGVFQALRDRNILVRYFGGERTASHLRVTIGTEPEMAVFLRAMEELR